MNSLWQTETDLHTGFEIGNSEKKSTISRNLRLILGISLRLLSLKSKSGDCSIECRDEEVERRQKSSLYFCLFLFNLNYNYDIVIVDDKFFIKR